MSRILITGAGGLLGSHLVPLLSREHELFALGRGAPEGATAITADLSNPVDPAALPANADSLVYLAQSPRFRDFPDGAADMFQVNVAQPLALLDWARRASVRRFVYASSGSVYAPSDRPIREDDPTPAPGFYASTKLAAERLALAYGGMISVVCLRFFFIYGRGQKRDMLLPRLVDSVREGRPVTLQGSDGIRLNPVHAEDAARATAAALELDGAHAINVAGPEALSIRRICEAAGAALGRDPVFESAPPAAGDLVADISRMSERLISPRIPFVEGVRDLL